MWEVWLWAALCSGLVLSAPRLGESTELAWLLVHDSPPQQSPLLLRRITPKSVFLTPTFTSCSEGYRQDGMGRCVKVVKLDQQAQWEFLLQKLNSMYAAPEPSRKENPGPLKLPIPIEEEQPSTTGEPPSTTEQTTISTTQPTTLQTTTQATTTTEPTTQQTTEPPFLIVVENTTDPMETSETTVTEITTSLTEETSSLSTISETSTLPSTQELAETFVTESFLPLRNTIRFPMPDGRKRPSSYIRFPEHYPSAVPPPSYWWPHSWERTQVGWAPPGYHSRPSSSYHREPPRWSTSY